MTQMTSPRIAWFNGKFMPENQVLIPFRDRCWRYGDGAFYMTRTFNGRAFRLNEHIDRFYHSLRYLRLDPGISPREMIEVSEQIVSRNEHLRAAAGDWWIGQRASRGVDPIGDEVTEHSGPNVVVECTPLPLKARARQFRDGFDVWTPAQRRIAPDMLSPRAKTTNYLNMIVAEQSVKAHDPEGWAVLLDVNGNLAEGMGCNIFVVREGKLYTPSERYIHACRDAVRTRDDLADIVNVALEELVRQRYELPAFNTILRAARAARSEVNQGYYSQVRERLSDAAIATLTALLARSPEGTQSPWDRIDWPRFVSTRSPKAM